MLRKLLLLGTCAFFCISCSSPSETPARSQESETPSRSQTSEPSLPKTTQTEDTAKQATLLQIQRLTQERELISRKMIGRQTRIDQLTLQMNELSAELKAFDSKVEAFKQEHRVEVVCREALGISLGNDNRYSDDQKTGAAVASTLCTVGALSDAKFRQSATFVFDELTKADKHAKNLQTRISEVQSQVKAEIASLDQDKEEADKLSAELEKQQTQLRS